MKNYIFVAMIAICHQRYIATVEQIVATIPVSNSSTTILIVQGDIVQQPVDAIVNAANSTLIGGAGVALAIQKAAGEKEFKAYIKKHYPKGCPTGTACIMPSLNLAKGRIAWIINAVGPHGRNENRAQLIKSVYRESLNFSQDEQYHITSIAFPAISADIFGYDLEESAPHVIEEVFAWIKQNPHVLREIRFVFFHDAKKAAIYEKEIELYVTGKRGLQNLNRDLSLIDRIK